MIPNCLKHLHVQAVFLLLLLQVESVVLASSWNNTHANIKCYEKERRALLQLKQGLVDHYGRLSSWNSHLNPDCCKWLGIQCNNQTGYVEMLDLGNKADQPLGGEISASLTGLRHLNHLDLSWDDFDGIQIPDFLGSLTSLRYIDFTHASFGGRIPHQIGKLSSLQILILENNYLVGVIPYQFGNLSSLQQLSLSGNHLGGIIPYHLGNLSSLNLLYLDNNDNLKIDPNDEWMSRLYSLTDLDLGSVSSLDKSSKWLQMVVQFSKLEFLGIENCSLSDMDILPLSVSNLSASLSEVYLSRNYFTSSIFTWLFNLSSNLVSLHLQQSLQGGRIPDDLGSKMRSLQYLYLSFNQLHGTIPKSFRLLSLLKELHLEGNSMEGVITDVQFDNLTNLLGLHLSQNSFTVKFSDELNPKFQPEMLRLQSCTLGHDFLKWLHTQNNLASLDLSNTRLSDTTKVTSFLCVAGESLLILNISQNHLSGQIPNCWNRMKSIRILDLSNNAFSGNIPNSMGSLVMIRHLVLRNNRLTGKLPSLKNCIELVLLDVGSNELSGPVPSWIGSSLQQLQVLNMRKNHFHGSLPLSLCHLTAIQVLYISQNNLSGQILKCLKNFSSMVQKRSLMGTIDTFYVLYKDGTLRYVFQYDFLPLVTWKGKELIFKDNKRLLNLIDLSSNQLSGNIPPEIGNLLELISMDLSSNNLSGEIPPQIGNLHSLDFLNLSRNHLSGRIPSNLSEITMLSVLDVSKNNLSGTIPISTQLQSFGAGAYEGNAYLCGKPLERACPEDKTSEGPRAGIDHEENHEDFPLSEGFYISMGLGFATGFWGVFGSLLLFRPWRHAYFNFLNNLEERIWVLRIIILMRCRRWLNM